MLKKEKRKKGLLSMVVKQNLIISLQAVNLVLRCGRMNRLWTRFTCCPYLAGICNMQHRLQEEGGPGKDHTIGAMSYHRRPFGFVYSPNAYIWHIWYIIALFSWVGKAYIYAHMGPWHWGHIVRNKAGNREHYGL